MRGGGRRASGSDADGDHQSGDLLWPRSRAGRDRARAAGRYRDVARPVRVPAGARDAGGSRRGARRADRGGSAGRQLGFVRAAPNLPRRGLPLEVHEPLPVIEFASNAITRSAGTHVARGRRYPRHPVGPGRPLGDAGMDPQSAPRLDGLASTYNTAMHLLVLGRDGRAMQRAAEAVAASDGGIALDDGWTCALPIAGMMMDAPFAADGAGAGGAGRSGARRRICVRRHSIFAAVSVLRFSARPAPDTARRARCEIRPDRGAGAVALALRPRGIRRFRARALNVSKSACAILRGCGERQCFTFLRSWPGRQVNFENRE